MIFRQAEMRDLPRLKAVFKKITENMNANEINIWDEIYPCEFFEKDIKSGQLYVIYNGNELLSAFALCAESAGEQAVKWHDSSAKAIYVMLQ